MYKIFLSLAFTLCFFIYSEANALDDNKGGPTQVICNVVRVLSGPISQAIATLVIIITGYSFFVGKVSIGMLFIVAAGVMFVFGAPTIMLWVLGEKDSAKNPCSGGSTSILQSTTP